MPKFRIYFKRLYKVDIEANDIDEAENKFIEGDYMGSNEYYEDVEIEDVEILEDEEA